jgi:hypothetical protein
MAAKAKASAFYFEGELAQSCLYRSAEIARL